ncbi:multidrug efflux SMR transporter [Fretibacter rubidus]|uniref:DMT family transporter n=1 Tax=Fretibacter rubidus TaxID=570162 RepID=UPI00352BB329
MNAWMFLGLAIVFEVTGTMLLKASNGFEKVGIGMASIACYSICFWMLAPAIKVIPVGVAYAIWAGMGIVCAAALSILLFDQKLALTQYGFIGLILIGAVGLNLTTQH